MTADLRQHGQEKLQKSHRRTQCPGRSVQEGGSGKPYLWGFWLQRDSRTVLETQLVGPVLCLAQAKVLAARHFPGASPSGHSVSEQQVMFLGYFCSLPLPHDLTHCLPLPPTEPCVLCGQEEPPLETLRCTGMAKPILMGW